MVQRVLFTLRTTSTMTIETWERFTQKARQAGTSPAALLIAYIHKYLGAPANDPTHPNTDGHE